MAAPQEAQNCASAGKVVPHREQNIGILERNSVPLVDHTKAAPEAAESELLEQLRRELVEIVPPVDPGVRAGALFEACVEAVLLQKFHRGLAVGDETVVGAGAEPDQLQSLLQAG